MKTRTAIGLLIATWLILCTPWFVGKRTISWDSKSEFYPSMYFVSESLRHGELPFWNPYVYSGYPMISDPQSMMFSPLAVILMMAVDKPSFHWFDAVEMLHVLMGGVGMLLLAIRLGRSPTAGFFSGMVYMFGGSAGARLQHVPMILSYGYFPFAMLALKEALDSRRLRWAVCFGIVAGIMAAHQNQVAYLFTLVLIGYVIYRAASAPSFAAFFTEQWRVLTAAVLAGTLTLSVPLYATLQFLPLSNRPNIPFEFAIEGSLHPLTFLTLFVRNFFGNAHLSTFWGLGDITVTYLYAGTLPVVLVARYGLATGALFTREFRYFLAVGLFAVCYALGGFTPLYWLFYHALPGVDLYRRPADATFLINMVLALATGFLMDGLLSGSTRTTKRFVLVVEIAVLTVLFTAGLRYAWQQDKLESMTTNLSWAVVFVVAALALLHGLAVTRAGRVRNWLVFAAMVLLSIDLNSAGIRMNLHDPALSSLLEQGAVRRDPLANFLADNLNSDSEKGPPRVEILWAGALWSNAPMTLGIQSTEGYNPLRYALYDRVAGSQEFFAVPRRFTPMAPSFDSPLLNLLGVKYIASSKPLSEIDPAAAEARFPAVLRGQDLTVWSNPRALPRVMIATSVHVEPDLERAIDEGRMAAVDYRSTVVLQKPLPLPGEGEASARLVSYRNSEVTIAVQSNRDVIVVLNDLYYPYWRVYVDGAERELLQANYLFRGVHVRPGESEVTFRFEPLSWHGVRTTFGRLFGSWGSAS